MDALGDRMKNYYENRAKTYLTRRVPVIIRVDGKSFHTWTKGLKRPYDEIFHTAMNETTKYLCKNIQGCKLGFTQSDEINLLLTDYDTITSDGWFDYSVQKLCSISASMATLKFNQIFNELALSFVKENAEREKEYCKILLSKLDQGGIFDARCFNVPDEEVTNCFVWRQVDATRNAIQILAQTHFTHDELLGKSNSNIQDMLMLQKGINFNDMPTEFKRGVCCIKSENEQNPKKAEWIIDKNIPIFTQNRDYVESTFVRG